MKIFLIRHGESKQNTRESYQTKTPDFMVELTEEGIKQAHQAGMFLKEYLEQNPINKEKSILWMSPYTRTRHTASIINEYINIEDTREDISLIEQRFGLFSNSTLEEREQKFEREFKYYNDYYQNGGSFYAKFPQGESPLDVALRVRQFIETVFRDFNNGTENIIIVGHGVSLKTFRMSFFHYSPEWYNKEKTMGNCNIMLIQKELDNFLDKGYIYQKNKERTLKK